MYIPLFSRKLGARKQAEMTLAVMWMLMPFMPCLCGACVLMLITHMMPLQRRDYS